MEDLDLMCVEIMMHLQHPAIIRLGTQRKRSQTNQNVQSRKKCLLSFAEDFYENELSLS